LGRSCPLPSGQKQVDQRDQRSTHPGGDQDVVGSEVALGVEVDQGFIRSLGHIGRLRPGAESLCEAGHTGRFFFAAGCWNGFPAAELVKRAPGQGFARWASSFNFVSPGAAAAANGYGCRPWSTPWNRSRSPSGGPSPVMTGCSQRCGRSSHCRLRRASRRPSACGTKFRSHQHYSPAICSRGRALRSLPRSRASSLAM
jgi:hypothetical protein